jgi:tetratricopeptide (TPR) repeat protein
LEAQELYKQQMDIAVGHMRKGQMVDAENIFQNLMSTFGERPELFQALGTLSAQKGFSGMAAFLLQTGIDKGYDRFEAYHNLGNALRADNKADAAAAAFRKAYEKSENDSHRSDALVAEATLYINTGDPQRCIDLCNKALELEPDHRFALWNRGIAYLEAGNWVEGFKAYDEAGFRSDQGKAADRKFRDYGGKPEWFPSKQTRRASVVVYGEQGIGDELMFASMIPDLQARSGRVIIDCDVRLKDLFQRSFPDCTIYTTSAEEPTWIKDDPPDYRLAMGSLGRHFRRKDSDFPKTPYIKADPEKAAYWKAELDKLPGRKIGISWVGGSKYTRTDLRSIPLPLWEPIAQTENVSLVSLQYHKWAGEEASRMGNLWNKPVHHWQDAIDSYDETAGLLAGLDLVITINTSVVHLCGSMGVKTWCLTPHGAAWRYGLKGGNPFYGSVEMYRQENGQKWSDVIAGVAHDLAHL